jgi:hypothetical protein
MSWARSNFENESIEIHINLGNFEFRSESIPVSYAPLSADVGDIDGDGNADIVTSEHSTRRDPALERITVFLGTGDGRFEHATDVFAIDRPVSLAVANFNQDQYDDVAVASEEADTVNILFSNGDGTFQEPVEIDIDKNPRMILAADFDDDGAPELIVTTGARSFRTFIFLNDGAGNFVQTELPEWTYSLFVLAAHDLNRDGHLDFAIAKYNVEIPDEIRVAFGNGDGTFSPIQSIATMDELIVMMQIDDYNGDRFPDFLYVAGNGTTRILHRDTGPTESEDCNFNLVPDECDIASGSNSDIDDNNIPDVCEPDCNGNLAPDHFDIATESSRDLNANGVPDECEADCNDNTIPDDLDIFEGRSADIDTSGVPDECEFDCNKNSIRDEIEIADGTSQDVNENAVPDECDPDCNDNNVPDDVDIAEGVSEDADRNGKPDECRPPFRRGDVDHSGVVDITDPLNTLGQLFLAAFGFPCSEAADSDDSGQIDITDALQTLNFLFLGRFTIPAPGPFACGENTTPDVEERFGVADLGCEFHPPCDGAP